MGLTMSKRKTRASGPAPGGRRFGSHTGHESSESNVFG